MPDQDALDAALHAILELIDESEPDPRTGGISHETEAMLATVIEALKDGG